METEGKKMMKLRMKYRFKNLGLAKSFSQSTLKPSMIFMGDDEYFWVVTLADAGRLLKAGYEEAR